MCCCVSDWRWAWESPAQCSASSHKQRRRILCFCEQGVSLPITVEVARGGGRRAVEGTGGFFWIAVRTRAWAMQVLPAALGRDLVTWALGVPGTWPRPRFSPLPQNAIPCKQSSVGPDLCCRVLCAQRTGRGRSHCILEAGYHPTLARMASLLLGGRAPQAVSGGAQDTGSDVLHRSSPVGT